MPNMPPNALHMLHTVDAHACNILICLIGVRYAVKLVMAAKACLCVCIVLAAPPCIQQIIMIQLQYILRVCLQSVNQLQVRLSKPSLKTGKRCSRFLGNRPEYSE